MGKLLEKYKNVSPNKQITVQDFANYQQSQAYKRGKRKEYIHTAINTFFLVVKEYINAAVTTFFLVVKEYINAAVTTFFLAVFIAGVIFTINNIRAYNKSFDNCVELVRQIEINTAILKQETESLRATMEGMIDYE